MPKSKGARAKRCKNSKDPKVANPKILFQVFHVFRFMIWDFLFAGNTNYDKDSKSLIIASQVIREALYAIYVARACFTFEEAKQLNSLNKSLIREMIYDERTSHEGHQIEKQIIEVAPCLHKLTLMGASRFNGDQLPQSLIELEFYRDHKEIIKSGDLPQSLLKLTLPRNFNQEIFTGFFPSRLQTLNLGHSFNKKIDHGVLPPGLTELLFGDSFNQTIESGVLPTGLTKLSVGDSFDQIIGSGVLPTGLAELSFGILFNQTIESGILPTSLKKLVFWQFNQVIGPGILPDNIRELTLGWSFDQLIEPGNLPKNLEILDLGYYDQPLDADTLPKNLVHLEIIAFYSHQLMGVLPKNLKSLNFANSYGRICALGKKHVELIPGLIPDSVQKLGFMDPGFDQDLERLLPPGLTELTFGRVQERDYVKPLIKSNGNCFLPLTLKKMVFKYENYEYRRRADILKRIESLNFGQKYFQGYWILTGDNVMHVYNLAWILKQ